MHAEIEVTPTEYLMLCLEAYRNGTLKLDAEEEAHLLAFEAEQQLKVTTQHYARS